MPENIELRLKKLESQSLSLEQSLNDAYEIVYKMNAELGEYTTKVSMAMYRWLLSCKTALPVPEVLELVTLSLKLDPDLSDLPSRPLKEDLILHVWKSLLYLIYACGIIPSLFTHERNSNTQFLLHSII
jgi:hypothetical protein